MLLRTPARFAPSATPHFPRCATQGEFDDPPDFDVRPLGCGLGGFAAACPRGPRRASLRPVLGQHLHTQDWERFYHYPYVYYPQNFWGNEYYRSADSLYYRYPAEMRIPVYNRHWHNEYPSPRKYYSGSHFVLDVF